MTETAKQARREYYRQWRRNNPEKVRETQQRYWLKKAAEQNQERAAEPGQHEKQRRTIEL